MFINMKIISILWILQLNTINGQFQKDLTLHSISGRLESNKSSIIQCTTNDDSFDKIVFSRPHYSGFDDGLPKSRQIFLRGSPFYDSLLFMPDKDESLRFGPYQCEITMKTDDCAITTQVVTLKLGSSDLADIEAVSPYIVVDPFAQGYILEVNVKKTFPLPIKWRRNGYEIKQWTGSTKVVEDTIISPGIYETYYEGRRHLAVHAIMRIVIGSATGNNDDFGNPPCYNGGAYNDRFEECICPPGFTGDKCEKACGANKFGSNCDKLCSWPHENEDDENLCSGHLFCKPDPYGCSCAPGFKGTDCTERCDSGWYGADCKQQCHCLKGGDSCDRITGVCDGGCLAGWGGESCQIQVCPSNHYGLYCENDCACYNGAKCANDGSCDCIDKWLGKCCDSTLPKIVSTEIINAVVDQYVNLTCTGEGYPEPWIEIEKKHQNSFEVKHSEQFYQPSWSNASQVIVEVKPKTEGFYRFVCTATNLYGKDFQIMQLIVNKS